jgi:hypothetical protein
MTTCPLCNRKDFTVTGPDASFRYFVTCNVCGDFAIEGETYDDLKDYAHPGLKERLFLLSAMSKTGPLRGVKRLLVDSKLMADLRDGKIVEPRFKEKRESLLKWYAYLSGKEGSRYGARVPVDLNRDYPAAYCRELQGSEWHFLFDQLTAKGFVKMHSHGSGDKVEITDRGWEHLEEHPLASGALAFVAMAFKDMNDVYAAIEAGVRAAGYQPVRIDKEEYVGGVMDEIKARIRESFFVISDLTQNRGGVYYEAGFADALDKKVIFTVQEDHLDPKSENRVHFDVQHLNTIAWKRDDLADLTKRLKDRIEAVCRPGPLK